MSKASKEDMIEEYGRLQADVRQRFVRGMERAALAGVSRYLEQKFGMPLEEAIDGNDLEEMLSGVRRHAAKMWNRHDMMKLFDEKQSDSVFQKPQ